MDRLGLFTVNYHPTGKRPDPTDAPSRPTTQATTEKRITTSTEEIQTTERPTKKPTTTQPSNPPPTEKPTTTQPGNPLPDKCKLRSYDAFFNGLDGKTYAVSGAYYWIIKQRTAGTESGPHKLAERFPGLQTPVDAAFSKNGKTYFFRGSRFWKYRYSNGIFIAEEDDSDMSSMGLSALHNMDAAFVYRNGKTYFLKGTQYWRYNDNYGRIDSGYPRTISKGWRGVVGTFDGAITWKSNAKTYLFKGENYVRINPKAHEVDSGYPQNTALKWMKCDPRTLGKLSSLSVNPAQISVGSLSTQDTGP